MGSVKREDPCISKYPEQSFRIFFDEVNVVIWFVQIIWIGIKGMEVFPAPVKPAESPAGGSPDYSLRIFIDGMNEIIRK